MGPSIAQCVERPSGGEEQAHMAVSCVRGIWRVADIHALKIERWGGGGEVVFYMVASFSQFGPR